MNNRALRATPHPDQEGGRKRCLFIPGAPLFIIGTAVVPRRKAVQQAAETAVAFFVKPS